MVVQRFRILVCERKGGCLRIHPFDDNAARYNAAVLVLQRDQIRSVLLDGNLNVRLRSGIRLLLDLLRAGALEGERVPPRRIHRCDGERSARHPCTVVDICNGERGLHEHKFLIRMRNTAIFMLCAHVQIPGAALVPAFDHAAVFHRAPARRGHRGAIRPRVGDGRVVLYGDRCRMFGKRAARRIGERYRRSAGIQVHLRGLRAAGRAVRIAREVFDHTAVEQADGEILHAVGLRCLCHRALEQEHVGAHAFVFADERKRA